MNTFEGSTALVTGATAGIGYAIALELARQGADVIVHGRNAERGDKAVQEIENIGGRARFVAADLSNADDVRRLAAEAGDVDILINNAGIYRFAPTVDTTDADFDDQINTNLRAPHGHGTVINMTTVAASTPAAGVHGASKAALELLTKLWADEIANAVTPGLPRGQLRQRRGADDRGRRAVHQSRLT
jgi:NAD(P)-dependent dehydrogenase (short-subunit alcohol dehydrogenase family)